MSTSFVKLDRLTQDLYQELVVKADQEIEEMKAKAQAEIEAERQKMLEATRQEVLELKQSWARQKEKQENELKQLALKVKEDLKSSLEEELFEASLSGLKQGGQDEIWKEMLLSLPKEFNSQDFKISLPAEWLQRWQDEIKEKLPKLELQLNTEIQAIKIQKKGEAFYYTWSTEEFEKLFKAYLSEGLKQLFDD